MEVDTDGIFVKYRLLRYNRIVDEIAKEIGEEKKIKLHRRDKSRPIHRSRNCLYFRQRPKNR